MSKPLNIEAYVNQLNILEKKYFDMLKSTIEAVASDVKVTLFVSQPYFFLPKDEHIKYHYRPSIMLSFFKDHVNIFATANQKYRDQLKQYKMTEKHTLQIYFDQVLPKDILMCIFKESLSTI